MRHGPHHGAHMSSNTGSGERSTDAAKLASVIVTGLVSIGKGLLHLPQLGCSPCAIFANGTRLVAHMTGIESIVCQPF